MITVDTARWNRQMEAFLRQNHRDFVMAVADATNYAQSRAKRKVRDYTRNSKVRSGTLVNGIEQEIVNSGYTGVIRSKAAYSEAFEYGQRPHIVRVKNKRVLAGPYRGRPEGWRVSAASKSLGYATYGKRVRHPGTKPRPFMFPAWVAGQVRLNKGITRAFR